MIHRYKDLTLSLKFPTKLDFTMLSISKGTLFGKVRSFLEDSTQDRTGHRTGGTWSKSLLGGNFSEELSCIFWVLTTDGDSKHNM